MYEIIIYVQYINIFEGFHVVFVQLIELIKHCVILWQQMSDWGA